MTIIDVHLRSLITGEQYKTSFQYDCAFVWVSKITYNQSEDYKS